MDGHPMGAELFHADRRTCLMKLIVAFRNFANASKTNIWQRKGSLAFTAVELQLGIPAVEDAEEHKR